MSKPVTCTTCDDTGVAVYPLRVCGDCDAAKHWKEVPEALRSKPQAPKAGRRGSKP